MSSSWLETGAVNLSDVAVADPSLFDADTTEPRLLGSRCSCGAVTFPAQPRCPRCAAPMARHPLERRGTLWSYTVQGFRPKSPPYTGPDHFEPYGVGYVDLDGEVIVEARLTTSEPGELSIGLPMRLVLIPFRISGDGARVFTFGFARHRDEQTAAAT